MLRNAEVLHYASGFSQYLSLISSEIQKISASSSQNTMNLLEIIDDMELNISISEQDYSPEIAILHILAYLGIWDLNNLRFLLKRMPKNTRNSKELEAFVEIFRAAWTNNYTTLFENLKKASFSHKSAENIRVLLDLVRKKALLQLKAHILKNFSSFSSEHFARLTNFNSQEIQAFCAENHWKIAKNGEISFADAGSHEDVANVVEKELKNMAEMVSFMEKLA